MSPPARFDCEWLLSGLILEGIQALTESAKSRKAGGVFRSSDWFDSIGLFSLIWAILA
jgi:hypothetical protein